MSSGMDFFESAAHARSVSGVLDALKWDRDGLVTVVSQEARTKEVLGVAFASRAALEKTLATGLMHYYSRSRRKLWLKGEQSGHVQKLVELRVDCDGDAILARVRQVKGNCHLGYLSCFSYRVTKNSRGQVRVAECAKRVFDPSRVYADKRKP